MYNEFPYRFIIQGEDMPRPTKLRIINFVPENKYFIPAGVPKCNLEEMKLKIEELEAMRLKDIENLSQEECAEKMNISRQTFQNIIDEARRKVAVALTEGKAISIVGGNYTFNICRYKCNSCGNEFDEAYEKDIHTCAKCGSTNVSCIDTGSFCMKSCGKRWCQRT